MGPLPTGSSLTPGSTLPTGTVTFLFTDIQGSTPLWESQPEKMGEALQVHNAVLRQAIEAHGGAVFKTVGDAFQAAFPTAPQALKAAIMGQLALQAAPWNELGELKVRMGLHTGEAALDPGGDEYAVSHTKNRAARIMSAAYGGQVLLSQETKELVDHQLPEGVILKDLGVNRLKGMVQLERLYQLEAHGLPADFPPLATSVQHPHNLPERLTSFVGRQAEIEDVCRLLLSEGVRLLTITGVGGTGKTSLAQQAGWKLLESFPDGIFFIDLAPIKDASLVLSTVAAAINLHQLPGKPVKMVLAEHLAQRTMLLILDNFEQVLPAGGELVDLIRSAPQLKLVVTSRELLHVSPEIQYTLSPMRLPPPVSTHETLKENEAVRLFIERAQVIQPDLRLSAKNGDDIAEICRRLDGLPLAIELIAARLSLFSLPQLSQQLSNRLRLLAGGWRDVPARHHTMRSAIAWSCELLAEAEKSLFYKLAVFPGSFSLEAAEAMCGAGGLDVLSGLESLLDKHLVNRLDINGQFRFWLFETLREYGLEQLAARGELDVLQSSHAAYIAQLVGKSTGQDYALWDLERHNLRAAFNWAIDHQDTSQAYIFGQNFFAWERQVGEGRQLISRALALPFTQALASERWWVIYGAVALALFSRDFPAARQWLDELGALGSQLGQNYFDFYHKFLKSLLFTGLGEFDAAVEPFSEVLEAFRSSDIFTHGLVALHLSVYILQTRHYARVKSLVQEAMDFLQQTGDATRTNPYLVDCASVRGYTALEEQQPDQAVDYFRQAFKLALELSVLPRVGTIYQGLGGAAMQSGNLEESVHWMSLAKTIAKATGLTARIMLDKLQERYLKELQHRLEPALFTSYWEAGQQLSMEQAIAYGEEHLLTVG